MITNEVQHRATQTHLRQFDEAIANLEATRKEAADKKLHDLQLAGIRSQAEDLREELGEYERLRSGAVTTFEANSLAELAPALVKARIARGWTQRRLADELGVAEQQIQRYESTGYATASMARLCDLVTALCVDVREVVSLTDDAV